MTRLPERGVTQDGEPARMPAAGRVCGDGPGPGWCEVAVFARGLCKPHYRRAAKGLELDPDGGKQVGITPSGRGVWGVLETDGERLMCHEGGRWFVALGVHVGMQHSGVARYRLAHGLLMRASLNAAPLRDRLAEVVPRDRLDGHRDPDAARALTPQDRLDRGRRLRRATGGR